jgi:hypothetical protein
MQKLIYHFWNFIWIEVKENTKLMRQIVIGYICLFLHNDTLLIFYQEANSNEKLNFYNFWIILRNVKFL